MQAEFANPHDNTGNRLSRTPRPKGAATLAYAGTSAASGTVGAPATGSYPGSRYPNIATPTTRCLRPTAGACATASSADAVRDTTGYAQNLFADVGIRQYAFGRRWLTEPGQASVQSRHPSNSRS